MRGILIAACLGSALSLCVGAHADAMEPQVIPGIGPETYGAPGPQPVYQPGAGYVRPRIGMQPPMGQPVPRRRANYGGGLLEALIGPGAGDEPVAVPQAGMAMAYNSPATQPAYAADPYAVRPTKMIDPMFQRQEVAFEGRQPAGTIVIDTTNKFLYLVEGGGTAMRYGIGVGRPGFIWQGTKTITRKAEWPDWTPPSEMLLRRPDLPTHMEGGMANPLGARAMYLGSSLYRIHGTNEPETIGTNVSSGCIRLTNEDVSDLYNRVRVGTRVVVL